MDLEPSLHARALLLHAEREVDGSIRFGGRTLRLRGGQLEALSPASEDATLVAFAERAGWIDEQTAARLPRAESEDAMLALREVIGGPSLRRARRSAWIDRLSRALTAAGEDAPPPELIDATPAEMATRALPPEALAPLVLEALTRRAVDRDAGVVGARAHCVLAWNRSASLETRDLARKWLGLESEELSAPLSRLFVRQPGAAPRVAAVIRAGLAHLADPGETPRTSLVPSRDADRDLTPGASVPPPAAPLELRVSLPPTMERAAIDPLDALEARVRQLEEMGAPGPERADAWREIAETWRNTYGSLEEASRAYREAAAADPTDTGALMQAAETCAALGQADLARAYAHAARDAAAPNERFSLRRREAEFALRAGDQAFAEEALSALCAEEPTDERTWRLLMRASSDPEVQAEGARVLAERAAQGVRLRRAYDSGELSPDEASEFATSLAADGHPEAAIQMLAEEAASAEELEVRRRLRLESAEHAERAARPDLAVDALLAAHLDEPYLEVLFEPLVSDASNANFDALAAVLQERFAILTQGEERAEWLLRAASAYDGTPGGSAWARELLVRAYLASPTMERTWDALLERAANDSSFLADAVERALRADAEAVPTEHLVRLAALATEQLDAAPRAHAAWTALADRGHPAAAAERDKLASQMLGVRARLDKLLSAKSLDSNDLRELHGLLRDDPSARDRAIAHHRTRYANSPDRAGAAALERLYQMVGDDRALVALALDHTSIPDRSEAESLRFASLGAHASMWTGSWGAAFQLLTRWRAAHPHAEVPVEMLHITASEANDSRQASQARRARLALPDTLRSVSALLVEARSADERVPFLERAIAVDPRSAGALEFLFRIDPPEDEPLRWVDRAREVLGDRPDLIHRGIEIAEAHVPDRVASLRAALARVDGISDYERVESALAQDDANALDLAARALVDNGGGSIDGWVIRSARRLVELGAADRAAGLLLAAEDATGEGKFLTPAEAAATSHAMLIRVLERRLPWSEDPVPVLVRIANAHREGESDNAEIRAWLRVLAYEPAHRDALTRLQSLYLERGDDERALATLEHEVANTEDDATRTRAIQRIATVAVQRMRDPERAAAALSQMTASGKTEGFAVAAATWVGLGQPERGIELLLAGVERDDVDPGALYSHAMRSAELTENDGPKRAWDIARTGLLAGARTPDLMLGFERLALRVADVDTTREVYSQLYDRAMGRHGRRGIRYREARWLERANAPSAAMEAYEAAFSEAPSDGVILSAIDRIARTTGELDRLAGALIAVADRQRDVDLRLQFERRIVSIFLDDLDDPDRAFDRLAEVWELTRRIELVPDLRRLARMCDAAPEQTFERILAVLRERVEASWNTDDQIRTLGLITEILALDMGRFDDAEALVDDELIPRLEGDEDADRALAASAVLRLAEALRAADRGRALARAEEASAMDPESREAGALVDALQREPSQVASGEDDGGQSESPPPEDATAASTVASGAIAATEAGEPAGSLAAETSEEPADDAPEEPADDAPAATSDDAPEEPDDAPEEPADDAPAATSGAAPETTSQTPSEPSQPDSVRPEVTPDAYRASADGGHQPAERLDAHTAPSSRGVERWRAASTVTRLPGEADLRQKVRAGDSDAARGLADLLRQAGRARESSQIALTLLRREPWDLEAVRLLVAASADAGQSSMNQVGRSLLATIGEGETPTAEPGDLRRPREAIDGGHAPYLDALSAVWTSASTLFAKPLSGYGAQNAARITRLNRSAIGRSLARAMDVLGDFPVDVRLVQGASTRVLRSNPAAVLIGEAIERQPCATFRVAHALERARAPHVLLSGTTSESDHVLEAIYAAFGPPAAMQEVSRDAASMASELWRLVGARDQSAIRSAKLRAPDVSEVFDAMNARATRAGFVASPWFAAAFEALLQDDPSCDTLILDAATYTAQLKGSHSLRELVRFAFSNAYLATLA